MRLSSLFTHTLREAPAEAETESHRLLLRAGYIRPLAAGIFSLMPLGQRAAARIEQVIREEMDAIGGQELKMPVVHAADIWKESQRWFQVGPELTRFQDRGQRDMVLAMTHEEVVADLVRREIRSYRQLPALVYHFQTKWRDEPRPRAGLIRVREFTMKDSYSLDADWDGLDKQYRAHYHAYFRMYGRCGLPVIAVKGDVGMMGGTMAHEFMYLTPIGEDTLFVCPQCGYSANREVARFQKPQSTSEAPLPLEKIATPQTTTIDSLAQFLNIPTARTAKAVFMMATVTDGETQSERFVLVIIRGDMEVNEVKLANAVRAKAMRPAREDEILAVGAVPGYGSAIGVRSDVIVVVDDALASSPNLVAGANEAGYHLLNVNLGRDFTATITADIAATRENDPCPVCATPLPAVRGVEVGNIFKLGTRYTDALGATFLDQKGESHAVIMGSYGIGIGRLLACVAEEYRDENGLKLPATVAPYPVHLVALPGGEDLAETLYTQLREAGLDPLYDDRDERAGVKFNDADLMGMPLRITVSKRTAEQGGVEVKRRADGEQKVVPLPELVAHLKAELEALRAAVHARIQHPPFDEQTT